MRIVSIAAFLLCTGSAAAADIGVVGLFPNKAVLVINGGAPKTYTVGTAIGDGVRLVAANESSAIIEINGKRQTISIGEYASRSAPGSRVNATLIADSRGHFVAQGQINGNTVRMLVDTGATMIALPAVDAMRLGINYKNGRPAYVNTANGTVPAYMVKLDTVKVGDIELNQVDAVVQEQGLPVILLGMSFLNRMEMRREGEQMVLTKRF